MREWNSLRFLRRGTPVYKNPNSFRQCSKWKGGGGGSNEGISCTSIWYHPRLHFCGLLQSILIMDDVVSPDPLDRIWRFYHCILTFKVFPVAQYPDRNSVKVFSLSPLSLIFLLNKSATMLTLSWICLSLTCCELSFTGPFFQCSLKFLKNNKLFHMMSCFPYLSPAP